MRFYFGVIQVLSIKSVGLFLIYYNVVVTVKGKKSVTVCSDFSTLQSPPCPPENGTYLELTRLCERTES